MRVAYSDGVFEELVSLSFYIAEQDEEAAQRFLDACDETFIFLSSVKRWCQNFARYSQQKKL